MNESELQRILALQDSPMPDDGFTESVLVQLPRKKHRPVSIRLLLFAYTLAGLLIFWLFPFEQLLHLLAELTLSPLLMALAAVLVSAAVSVISYFYAKEFITSS